MIAGADIDRVGHATWCVASLAQVVRACPNLANLVCSVWTEHGAPYPGSHTPCTVERWVTHQLSASLRLRPMYRRITPTRRRAPCRGPRTGARAPKVTVTLRATASGSNCALSNLQENSPFRMCHAHSPATQRPNSPLPTLLWTTCAPPTPPTAIPRRRRRNNASGNCWGG